MENPSRPDLGWSRHGAPTPLTLAAGLVLAEGLVALAYGLAEAVNISSSRVVMGASTALFFVLLGGALLACSWALMRVRSWGRGPVLLVQLMALGLAWNFRSGDTWGIAVALVVPAVVVLAGMLHPATIAALEHGAGRDEDGPGRPL